MAEKKDTILVTGITGQQGGAVARQLLKDGYPVVGLTRHPDKAAEIKKLGARIVAGDLTDRATLDRALDGIHKAFLVTTPYEKGVENETEQGVKFVDACAIAGMTHLVYSSVGSAHRKTGIPHFESKMRIEEHIKRVGIPHTILRPVFFYENFGASWMLPAVRAGRVSTPLRADRPLQMICVADVAKFVAAAFEKTSVYLGKEIDLAGDELTLPNALQIIGKATDRNIEYVTMPESEAEKNFGHDFAVMFKWFNDVGYNVDIESLEQQYKIRMTRFKDWMKTSALLKEVKEEAAVH
jgi:uncharacterized protein YbjT (DUF2867 family)